MHDLTPSASAEAPPGFDAASEQPWDTFLPADTERSIYVGGHPSPAALDTFAASGGTAVLNLKTPEEMAAWPNYRAAVESRGLTYVEIPTAPEAMGRGSAAKFRDAMATLAGRNSRVLVHCQASGRALYAVAIDRVKTGEMTTEEAIAWARWMRGGQGWPQGETALRSVGAEAAR